MSLAERYFDESPDAVVVVRDDGTILAANATVFDMLGYRPDDLIGRPVETLLPSRFAAVHRRHRDQYRQHRGRRLMGVGTDLWARCADGTELAVDVSLNPVETDDGPVTIAAIRDVTDRRRAAATLRATEHRFRLIFEHAPVGVALADVDGTLRRVNPALAAMLGVPKASAESTKIADWITDDDVRRVNAALHAAWARVEARLRADDDEGRWVLLTFAAVGGDDHEVVAVVEDITERRRDRLELEHRATHDSLTGLPNRLLLEERIRVALARSRRTGQYVGILFLDLDGFKAVNDELGHVAGDAVLVEVAHRVSACMRPEDTPARQGGDEFVVCCEDLTDEADVASRTLHALAARLLRALEPPLVVRERSFALSASVGIALGGPSDEDPAALIAAADNAMYEAKRLHRGGVSAAWELDAPAGHDRR